MQPQGYNPHNTGVPVDSMQQAELSQVQNGLPSSNDYQQPAADLVNGTVPATPSLAEDNDLIEKTWVEAAKRIIADNRNDPYAQSRAMTLLRKDYMKKRYGEDIKTEQ